MNKSEIQIIYIYNKYPRDIKILTVKAFVNIDIDIMGGTHCVSFYVRGNKSFYFDSFGGHPEKFLPNQLCKPKNYHN